jgi:dihydroorotase
MNGSQHAVVIELAMRMYLANGKIKTCKCQPCEMDTNSLHGGTCESLRALRAIEAEAEELGIMQETHAARKRMEADEHAIRF